MSVDTNCSSGAKAGSVTPLTLRHPLSSCSGDHHSLMLILLHCVIHLIIPLVQDNYFTQYY